jgi:hypothetical protein
MKVKISKRKERGTGIQQVTVSGISVETFSILISFAKEGAIAYRNEMTTKEGAMYESTLKYEAELAKLEDWQENLRTTSGVDYGETEVHL